MRKAQMGSQLPAGTTTTPQDLDIGSMLVGIDHIGVNVRNGAESADWYKNILGFSLLHKFTTTWLVGRGNIKLGLFERPYGATIADTDNTLMMQHIAFTIDQSWYFLARQRLLDRGIAPEEEDNGIANCLFFKDPNSHQLEIISYHP